MITLLHGDNITASREELMRRIDEAKKAGKDIRRFEGKSLDALTITQALESRSLFGGSILVVIEKFLVKSTKLPVVDTDVIIWEDKEIGKTLISALGNKVEVKFFKIPPAIWQLLDGMRLDLFHQALLIDAPERIFAMIVRRVRELIMVKDGVTPEGLQGWQAGRLTSQAKSFTMDKLLSMEKKLLEIDVSMKTGTSPFPLAQLLELFFIDL